VEQLVARWAHNPEVIGSSPVPATKREKSLEMATFFVLSQFKVLENIAILQKTHLLIELDNAYWREIEIFPFK
jgi:hypothetical protein